tara:strand:+ start:1079 stop:1426 length:348 start_codon:yes stop_codon:yes gene_type:complete
MKLTREFIRELINEEVSRMAGGKRKKVLKESIADMAKYQDAFEEMAMKVSEMFYDDMMKLFEEEPEAFEGYSREDWDQQVVYAQQEIDTGVATAIAQELEKIEMQLHDGQYFDGR